MNVLIIGSGGREDALGQKIAESSLSPSLFFLPGNGGTGRYGTNIPGSVMDITGTIAACREHSIDYVVVAPDDPLAAGMVDALKGAGIPAFGPERRAARIESSKSFAKDLMHKYSIPTASYEVFTDSASAIEYASSQDYPLVIKADGLALGKGVIIAESRNEAEDAIRSMMDDDAFGEAGRKIVIEEFLTGPEVTVLSFTDGKTIVPMVSSMDHKRALDGDEGLNTGGMGVIAPNPFFTDSIAAECMDRIFLPTIRAMEMEGCPFSGCLYFGLMLTPDGPKVIEYNSRFGDPEAEAILPLLDSDLLQIMQSVTEGRLDDADVKWKKLSSCCVVAASGGYPGKYEKGKEIRVGDIGDSRLFIAGATDKNGKLATSGGRVLSVCSLAKSLPEAIDKAYRAMEHIHFDGMFYRKDIGKRALEALNGV